jgi:hypothetical protein
VKGRGLGTGLPSFPATRLYVSSVAGEGVIAQLGLGAPLRVECHQGVVCQVFILGDEDAQAAFLLCREARVYARIEKGAGR